MTRMSELLCLCLRYRKQETKDDSLWLLGVNIMEIEVLSQT
jgi:hypothetical protein